MYAFRSLAVHQNSQCFSLSNSFSHIVYFILVVEYFVFLILLYFLVSLFEVNDISVLI